MIQGGQTDEKKPRQSVKLPYVLEIHERTLNKEPDINWVMIFTCDCSKKY